MKIFLNLGFKKIKKISENFSSPEPKFQLFRYRFFRKFTRHLLCRSFQSKKLRWKWNFLRNQYFRSYWTCSISSQNFSKSKKFSLIFFFFFDWKGSETYPKKFWGVGIFWGRGGLCIVLYHRPLHFRTNHSATLMCKSNISFQILKHFIY